VEALKALHVQNSFPGGENLQSAVLRVWDFIEKILVTHPPKKIVIVGHRTTYYALENKINHVPLESLLQTPWVWQEGWKYEIGAAFERTHTTTN
jgi:broad specificity phosphatase PhoE